MLSDKELRQHLRSGQDSRCEFKQVEFKGTQLIEPAQSELADEVIAFANVSGGVLVCGVTDDGQVQGMSREQAVELDRLLAD